MSKKLPRPKQGKIRKVQLYINLSLPFHVYAQLLGLDMPKVVDFIFSHMSASDVARFNSIKETRGNNLKPKTTRVGIYTEAAVKNWEAIQNRNRSAAFREEFLKIPPKFWVEKDLIRHTTYEEFFGVVNSVVSEDSESIQ